MYYQVISFNYKKCDLSQRELLVFKNDDEKGHPQYPPANADSRYYRGDENTCGQRQPTIQHHDDLPNKI